jgi:hypothetical protein
MTSMDRITCKDSTKVKCKRSVWNDGPLGLHTKTHSLCSVHSALAAAELDKDPILYIVLLPITKFWVVHQTYCGIRQ